ncbi:MAG: hypothetical protein ACOCM4_07195 [Acetivibrio ethanolgignens]
MKKVKWILTGVFLFAILQLGMQKGNKMIMQHWKPVIRLSVKGHEVMRILRGR